MTEEYRKSIKRFFVSCFLRSLRKVLKLLWLVFEVKAGETVSVSLGAGLHDFTVVDVEGKRKAWPGKWKVKFGVKETSPRMGFETHDMMAF